ncbi:hypothetical protein Acsp04_43740 [Actinomadura sp. NBRC 104425]|uniref:hypothetical protein n=1 Tax=Actinomadura sp. NBRC 104425 TaxID=3032204 RepID=UPI0024A56F1D|nr:hypothetical protein [Actinomadura sp. NBRC 104425]GLZ14139.1 hypothetical protein Acsp04_43740 [Actinomadura sp. NBRC 104425]
MNDRAGGHGSYNALAALAVRLSARGLTVDYAADGLHVANSDMLGCCSEVRHTSDKITCGRRLQDGGARWFNSSWRGAIAPADAPDDAALFVLGYLSGRAHPEGLS